MRVLYLLAYTHCALAELRTVVFLSQCRMIIGYAHVRADNQNLDTQTIALKAVGVGKIFADKLSGSKRGRAELDQLRDGDVVTVAKYDRLARSLKDLLKIVETIRSRGAGFRSQTEDIGTTTPAVWSVMPSCHCFYGRTRLQCRH